ncbi:hypothetical protein TTHERM_01079230 (macronuclear) [Tetrahymena thermophila SB210]|uniref:Uncharacterized protein n=1 Tax=Tetrahymena thermophila (strain SB210) TaxID=312017 RepID=Q24CC8_TETTS|nr:hypothetical protein TTHERM_01079230 [Tetrahymena thermophila SB210]EAS05446.2 hypothetical protein TTHERM_01079230 [Tetrahymena thermophila SB210]|eukprot:XP_001025691.2 hypothetical protein TTHERM_01079230 [Tetrahymena thermophila SB210]
MIVKSLIYRSFQQVSRLSITNSYFIAKVNSNKPKLEKFSQKLESISGKKEDPNIQATKPSKKQQNTQQSFRSRVNNNIRQKQRIEENPFKSVQDQDLDQFKQEDLEQFEQFSECIDQKKYEQAAMILQDILDNLEESKAHSDALQMLELQNSLYLYSRKYLDAYLVRSNISKYMEYAPTNYQKEELQNQVIKYFYQLIFTHQLQAEMDLDILYKNHYRQLPEEKKALFDLAIAVGHFISPDKEAQEKGVSFILNCIKNTQNKQILSYAFYNLGVYQFQLLEDPKKFMEEVIQNEQTQDEMKKRIQNVMNKINQKEKILISDLSNSLQNILTAINLNNLNVSVYSIQDILNNKHNLILCDKFSTKALLFLAQNYNLFNIQIAKSLRLQLMHFAYQIATQRKQHQQKANFLYASLFADIQKPEEAKKLLMQNLQDTSDPNQDPIRYETLQLLSLIDFENKYKFKKMAKEVIVKDNLQYWCLKLQDFELQPLHIIPESELKLVSEEELSEYKDYLEEGDGESDQYYTSEGEESETDVEVEYIKKWEKQLEQAGLDINKLKSNYLK